MDATRSANPNTQKTLILYWSATGNTEKVARAIERGAREAGANPVLLKVSEAMDVDLHAYDLVFLGSPSYSYMPPEPVLRFVKDRQEFHKRRGDIKVRAPRLPGKRAVVFVTYSGPHTGIDEAIPVGKYIGQLFAHIGYEVVDEWYVVGEFHGNLLHSTEGPLGDIRGRPNAEELANIERQTFSLVSAGHG